MQPPPFPLSLGAPEPEPEDLATLDAWSGAPETRREGARWILIAAIGFVGGQFAAMTLLLLSAAILGKSGELSSFASMSSPPEWYVICSLFGLWMGFLGASVFALRSSGAGSLRQGFGLRVKSADLLFIPLGILAQFGVLLLYLPFLDHLKNFNGPTKRLIGGSHGPGIALITVATALLAPLVEEIFFRGLIFRALVAIAKGPRLVISALALVASIALDGALFALAHAELVQFAGLMAFGCLLAFITWKTKRLVPAMVTHVAFNAIALFAAFGAGH